MRITSPKLSVLCTIFLSGNVFSGTMGPVQEPNTYRWVAGISAGPLWANAGRTQTFFLQQDVEKTYSAKKESNSFASGELFFGIQTPLQNWLQGQLGLAVATTGNAKLQGDIWEDADSDFNNFTYNYRVQHTRVTVKGKLIADTNWFVQPYINAGVGVGFNNAKDFSITPKIVEEVPAPPLSNNSKSSFAYTAGAGIQVPFGEHWQGGIGYEFADWGKSSLGAANGQTINTGIQLSHLYTNSIQFSLSYVS